MHSQKLSHSHRCTHVSSKRNPSCQMDESLSVCGTCFTAFHVIFSFSQNWNNCRRSELLYVSLFCILPVLNSGLFFMRWHLEMIVWNNWKGVFVCLKWIILFLKIWFLGNTERNFSRFFLIILKESKIVVWFL